MDEVHSLLKDITNVTSEIETDFPELYRFLDENPITIPIDRHPQIDKKVLQDYLQSLKHLLKHHIQTHQNFMKRIISITQKDLIKKSVSNELKAQANKLPARIDLDRQITRSTTDFNEAQEEE